MRKRPAQAALLARLDAAMAAAAVWFMDAWTVVERGWRRPLSRLALRLKYAFYPLLGLAALGWLAWRLWQQGPSDRAARHFALMLAGGAAWQLASGLSNVVLGWPLVAAVAHTGGAAALVGVLTALLTRAHRAPAPAVSQPERPVSARPGLAS